MAITKSAKKAHRQSLRKKAINDVRRKALRVAFKGARLAAQAGTAEKGSVEALSAAYQAIDKAYKRGLIKKNTAARRKASVAKLLKKA